MMKSRNKDVWCKLPLLSRRHVLDTAPELKIVGKCRNKTWTDKARRANTPMDKPLIEYNLKDYFIQQGWNLNDSLDNKSIVDPSQLAQALLNYGTPRSLKPNRKILDEACAVALADLGNPSEKLLSPIPMHSEILKASIKLDKSSGLPVLRSKLEAWDDDFTLATGIASGTRSWPPCICYNRVQHKDAGPKTRAVWGYGLSMTMLEARFARPIIMSFLSRKGSTPIAFGLLKYQMSSCLLPIENCRYRFSLDYSQFDATIPTYLIRKAFGILRSYLDLSDPNDAEVFEKCIQYFINTPILMPNGFIYRKNRGIPSGSYFTQLIGSIVNYICLQYAYISITERRLSSERVRVLGDDSCFGIDEYIEPEAFASKIGELGVIVHPDKSDVTSFGDDVPFLGVRWKCGFASRPTKDIIKRLVYPERYRKIAYHRHLTIFVAYLNTCLECWPLFYEWRRDICLWNLEIYGAKPATVPESFIPAQLRDVVHEGETLFSTSDNLLYLGMLF